MWQLETRFARINDVAHFSLLMGTNTYILQTHTQRQYYEVQVVFGLYFEVLHCNIRSLLRGREDTLFFGKSTKFSVRHLSRRKQGTLRLVRRVLLWGPNHRRWRIDTDRSTRGAEKQQSNNSSPCITGTSTRTSTWFVSDRYLLIRSTAVRFGCM